MATLTITSAPILEAQRVGVAMASASAPTQKSGEAGTMQPPQFRFLSPNKHLQAKVISSANNVQMPLAAVKPPRSIRPRMSLKDFEIGRKLGSGRFGKVFLAREVRSKYIVALKMLSIRDLSKSRCEHQVRREIEIQSRLNHPGVLKMFGYFWDDERIYIILEYCVGGQLFDLLKDEGKFSERVAADYIKQVSEALQYCHAHNVIHRDIKPENLLVSFNNRIKIADFGWSVHSSNKRETMCGTPDYIPPEMILGEAHDKTADLWAIGVLAYELICGDAPFYAEKGVNATYARIKKVDLKFPSYVSIEARDFIARLLRRNPSERMPMDKLLQHPWITNNTKPPANQGK